MLPISGELIPFKILLPREARDRPGAMLAYAQGRRSHGKLGLHAVSDPLPQFRVNLRVIQKIEMV